MNHQLPPRSGLCPVVPPQKPRLRERVVEILAGERPTFPVFGVSQSGFHSLPEDVLTLVWEKCWHGIWFKSSFITSSTCELFWQLWSTKCIRSKVVRRPQAFSTFISPLRITWKAYIASLVAFRLNICQQLTVAAHDSPLNTTNSHHRPRVHWAHKVMTASLGQNMY